MNHQDAIIQDILRERELQDSSWGGPNHDDEHCRNDWIALLTKHVGLSINDGDAEPVRFRKQMVRVAALALAALESYDRKQMSKSAGPGPEQRGRGV